MTAIHSARNFYGEFVRSATRFAQNVAVEVQCRDRIERFTYAKLHAMTERAAALLAARGLARGDRAAILADNDARWCAAYLGTMRLGGVAVPLDTAYKPRQIAALAADSGARILFTTPKYLPVAEAAGLGRGSCEIHLLDDFAGVPAPAAGPPPAALPECPARPQDPAVMLYTSGTTSDPKGVVLTHGNLLAERDAVLQVVRLDERDAILGVLPLFHALAQLANLLLPFAVGARVIFLETVNSSELLRALRERGATAFACVPQFFYLIHQRVAEEIAAAGRTKRMAFRSLVHFNGWLRDATRLNLGPLFFRRVHGVFGGGMRLLVTGGSRFDHGIGRELYRMGIDIIQAYGLTESCGAATVTRPGRKFTGSVGPPLPGIEVKIAPPQLGPGPALEGASREDQPGGEVLIRGPIVMQGYFKRADANAASLDRGWLRTGDLGYLDKAGELHITGRSKDVIVLSSGKNIHPEEIEAHYLQSPYIQEMCVVGLARADKPSAERLHAVVVPNFELLRERKIVNTREVLRFEIEGLSIHLPPHKRVLSYEIWTEELPRTTTRKLRRFVIEQRVRSSRSGRGESGAAAEPEAAPDLTPEELAWSARPEVAAALAVIRETLPNAAALRPAANIELDLGLDSMERVELLVRLEQRFGVRVPEAQAQRIYTVRELVEACLPRRGQGAAAASVAAAAGDPWSAMLAAAPEDDPELAELLQPKPVFAAVVFALSRIAYGFARLTLGLRVTGREHLPAEGAFLLCPNHQSYLDAFLLTAALPFRVFRRLFFVGASEYFATPLMRRLARKMNLVPVDPDTNLVRAMSAGAFGLRHGKGLVLFPEGERSIDGEIKKFKKGAPILALHLGAPVVPVALDGAFPVWPRGRRLRLRAFLPGSGARVRLRFGPPLVPDPLPAGLAPVEADAYYARSADSLRAKVQELLDSLRA